MLNYSSTMFCVFQHSLCAEIPTSKDLRSGDLFCIITLISITPLPSPITTNGSSPQVITRVFLRILYIVLNVEFRIKIRFYDCNSRIIFVSDVCEIAEFHSIKYFFLSRERMG